MNEDNFEESPSLEEQMDVVTRSIPPAYHVQEDLTDPEDDGDSVTRGDHEGGENLEEPDNTATAVQTTITLDPATGREVTRLAEEEYRAFNHHLREPPPNLRGFFNTEGRPSALTGNIGGLDPSYLRRQMESTLHSQVVSPTEIEANASAIQVLLREVSSDSLEIPSEVVKELARTTGLGRRATQTSNRAKNLRRLMEQHILQSALRGVEPNLEMLITQYDKMVGLIYEDAIETMENYLTTVESND